MFFKRVDTADQRRFTDPDGPQIDAFAALHGQVNVTQDVERTVPLVHAIDFDCDLVRDLI